MTMRLPVWLQAYRGRPVWAGFSGGADSMALLLALLEAEFAVTAVHFEHGLRGDAGREDAAFCRDFCVRRHIPYRQIALRLDPAAPTLEALAREHRLRHWRMLSKEVPGSVVALGHHAGDAAETLLMRLARGANASGLAALRPVRRLQGVEIIRPLLEWPRSGIEAFLGQRGIDRWCVDATNADPGFQRNYLRHQLLPAWQRAFPFVAGGLREAERNLSADAAYLEARADELFAARPAGEGLDCRWFGVLPEAMQIRVLRLWLQEAGGGNRIPDRALLERVTAQDHGIIPVDRELVLEYMLGAWYLRPASRPEVAWNWRRDRELDYAGFRRLTAAMVPAFPGHAEADEAYFDADRLPEILYITGPRSGDRLQPFGRRSRQPLKKFGHSALVVRDEHGEILWVPGLRHTAHAPVDTATRNIVHFRCIPGSVPETSVY